MSSISIWCQFSSTTSSFMVSLWLFCWCCGYIALPYSRAFKRIFFVRPRLRNAFNHAFENWVKCFVSLLVMFDVRWHCIKKNHMLSGMRFKRKKRDKGTPCDSNYDTCICICIWERYVESKEKYYSRQMQKRKRKRKLNALWCFMQISSSFGRTCEYSSLHSRLDHDVYFWNNSTNLMRLCIFAVVFTLHKLMTSLIFDKRNLLIVIMPPSLVKAITATRFLCPTLFLFIFNLLTIFLI